MPQSFWIKMHPQESFTWKWFLLISFISIMHERPSIRFHSILNTFMAPQHEEYWIKSTDIEWWIVWALGSDTILIGQMNIIYVYDLHWMCGCGYYSLDYCCDSMENRRKQSSWTDPWAKRYYNFEEYTMFKMSKCGREFDSVFFFF